MLWCFCHIKQIRKNKLIYQDKPRLKTALEMLRISMYIEDSLSQVNSFADDVVQNKKKIATVKRAVHMTLNAGSELFCGLVWSGEAAVLRPARRG